MPENLPESWRKEAKTEPYFYRVLDGFTPWNERSNKVFYEPNISFYSLDTRSNEFLDNFYKFFIGTNDTF